MKKIKLSLLTILAASVLVLGACEQSEPTTSESDSSISESVESEESIESVESVESEQPTESEESEEPVESVESEESEEPVESEESVESVESEQPTESEESVESEEPVESEESEDVEVLLSSITLSGTHKTIFSTTDTFTYEGLVVTANYTDGASIDVNGYTVSEPDLTTIGVQDVVVSYTEGEITKTASYEIEVTEYDLTKYQQAAVMRVSEAFDELDIDDYSPRQWDEIMDTLNTTIKAIYASSSMIEIDELVVTAINLFNSMETQEECVKGTLFDHCSGDYFFDKTEEGHLLIQYDNYPGRWVYVGTKNLASFYTVENVFSLTFSNNNDENIAVSLKIADESGAYEVETRIQTILARETKTFTLSFDYKVTNLYFFVDSTEEHNRSGEIEIHSYEFTYEEREKPTIPEAKTIDMGGQTFSKDVFVEYTVTQDDTPYNISRVDVSFEVDYHGNDGSNRWYDLLTKVGSTQYIPDGKFHTQSVKGTDGETDIGEKGYLNIPVPSDAKLEANQKIQIASLYNADGLTFKVMSITLFYSEWNDIQTEKVEVNKTIYENEQQLTAVVPYSSFTNKGRVNKMEIEFESVNSLDWAGSQVYISGFQFTKFPTGNNDVLNIAPIMDKDNTGSAVTGTMTVYPIEEIDLSLGYNIELTCWWSSGSLIKVKSITMHTEIENTEVSNVLSIDKTNTVAYNVNTNLKKEDNSF